MTAACRGICKRYKSSGTKTKDKYQHGQKRCTFCNLFLAHEGKRCPCCSSILRTRSRRKKFEN